MSKDTTPHRLVFTQVNETATTSTPTGAVSPKKREVPGTGMYNVSFPSTFDKAPAIALISASGTQRHLRVNQYGSENRTDHVNVDAYELNLGVKDGSVAWADTSFNMVAALSGGDGVRDLKRLGDDKTGLRVVAGVVDGTNTFNVEVDHGGYSLGSSSEKGKYQIDFSEGFAEAPVVLATIQLHDEKVRTVHVLLASTSSATIEIRNSDGERGHGNFHFIAIGKAAAGKETKSCRLVTGVVSRNGDKTLAGEGFDRKKQGTATYTIGFNRDYNFEKNPVVVACAEHMKETHLRQAQVYDVAKGGFKLDVYGFQDKDDQSYNNSAFHFIAYAPQ